jgi:hypothetical protein
MNGAVSMRSPGVAQRGVREPMNHVSGRAGCLPLTHGTGGGRLSPHMLEAAPAFPPRRMRRAVLPRVRRRNMTVAVSPGSRRDTTPALGFAGGGGLFFAKVPYGVVPSYGGFLSAGMPFNASGYHVAGPVVGQRTGNQFCLTTRHQPASDLRREGTKRLPVVGSLHGFNHEAVDEQEVGRLVQGRGNVQ